MLVRKEENKMTIYDECKWQHWGAGKLESSVLENNMKVVAVCPVTVSLVTSLSISFFLQ